MTRIISLLTALSIVTAAGFVVLTGGQDVVEWYTGDGTAAWPEGMAGLVVRVEFDVPAPIDAWSQEPKPRWKLAIPPEATGGRIFVAPLMASGDTGSFGREVDLLTGERLEIMHYTEQPGQWFATLTEGSE